MKILYGVQATGNGHITRARALAPALARAGVEVDMLFSGRDPSDLFDMAPFGNYRCYRGLTFAVRNGAIRPVATLFNNNLWQFVQDVRELNLDSYDLVLCDFEPVTAWAAHIRSKPIIGISHQYSFIYPIPQHRGSWLHQQIMKRFAPAKRTLGLHWHHFDAPLLPPIAPVEKGAVEKISVDKAVANEGHILVYLPFELPKAINDLLRDFPDNHFVIYHPQANTVTRNAAKDLGDSHLQWHMPSREGFQQDLRRCQGVICNAGFELASEALQLGKKLLVKPVWGQPEQASNALALELLDFGDSMNSLDKNRVKSWLQKDSEAAIYYPDVADAVANWLAAGATEPVESLSARLWQQAHLPDGLGGKLSKWKVSE